MSNYVPSLHGVFGVNNNNNYYYFIQQGCIKWIKSKDIYNVSVDLYSSKNPEKKKITVSTKILTSTAVFNIDNNKKCVLSTKSAY